MAAKAITAITVLGFVAHAGFVGTSHQDSLLQTWTGALNANGDTPVTRVVNLLKEMSLTLDKEMDEDQALYKQLKCWCSENNWEKSNSIEASEAKVEELEASIESLTAKSNELSTTIKELEDDVAANKAALAEATALREKQLQEFHGAHMDSIQALENLKAAILVLGKHHSAHGGTAPNELDSTVAGGAVFKSERDSWSLLAVGSKKFPWNMRGSSGNSRSLDNFMRRNGYDNTLAPETAPASEKFLQEQVAADATATSWSSEDDAIVKRALKSASAFMQARHGEEYYPAYTAQSGEIMGVLKQLKEEMEGDLAEAKKLEDERAATFADLRAAKSEQIANGEKMAEQKEDELADTNNALAEAKEDLEQEKKVLAENQKFLKNLTEICANADKNFEARKAARLEEIKAVAETIAILQQDNARDSMSGTFSFVQLGTQQQRLKRKAAATTLRRAALRSHNPAIALLANSVELDAFTKVKKAIDDMISMLKKQQEDEVKKNDWCKLEIHENEMATEKANDLQADLEARIAELTETIKSLENGIADAKRQIAQLQVDLQRASEDRKAENMDFQKTVADQTVTIEVLKVALDRLATYYDFLQQHAKGHTSQTPPVPQMEYKPSKGAKGVMEMIEKLVYDAKELRADSVKSESEAQAAYEQNVADTNDSVAALQADIVQKTEAKVDAEKDKLETESDHADTVKEMEGLVKYNGELHTECDYLLNNFNSRQKQRAEEIEALQQAKQILSGASLS